MKIQILMNYYWKEGQSELTHRHSGRVCNWVWPSEFVCIMERAEVRGLTFRELSVLHEVR